jgi:sec-independent protein translocase protein TatA
MGLPNIGPVELIIVLVIALLVLGPGKLPEVGSAFGKTIREFKKASSDITDSTSLTSTPSTPTSAVPAPNTLAQSSSPNTLADPTEPTLKGTPADPVADRA